MELKSVLLEKFTQLLAELVAEDLAECFDGQEESVRRVDPSGTKKRRVTSTMPSRSNWRSGVWCER
jgi:hypothetical protein